MALTQKDFVQLRILIDDRLDVKLDEKLDEKLKYLPTKDEFYKRMDEVMGELQTMRDELAIGTYHTSDQEERLQVLEKIHPDGKHAVVS